MKEHEKLKQELRNIIGLTPNATDAYIIAHVKALKEYKDKVESERTFSDTEQVKSNEVR
jgi:hypothetical protein